ncbi:outer membrane beta-barrel protein [Chitinophaga sp. YIM B06452]|uniref:outer membrane beta-barrel protein n=1 Tax=Chitinophaga sp. YIM B06452 TaxID=3082158 RepID=UPI0031FE5AEF
MSEQFENIIRKKLQEAEPTFDPAAWEQMKAKLDNADRRRPFFWWWAGGLLLVAGLAGWWWFARPSGTTLAQQQTTAAATDVNKSKQNTTANISANEENKIPVSPSATIPAANADDVDNPAGKNRQHATAQDKFFGKPAGAGNSSVQLRDHINANSKAGNNVNKPAAGNAEEKNIPSPGSNVNNTITPGNPPTTSTGGNVNNTPGTTPATVPQPSPVPANVNNPASGKPLPGVAPPPPANVDNPAQKPQPASDSADTDKPVSKKQKRGFDGGLFLGPDLNVTPAFKGLPIGVTGGLIVRYHVNNRWYLNTGVGYAKKLYGASPSEYTMSYPNAYYKIDADCDVIDVPLNVNYTFAEGKKSSWSVMAGASSYFMLKEKYTGTYNNNTKRDWIVKNKNQHYFSVINLGVTWEKQTRSRLTWGLQPYVKIPVGGVGQGSVKVYSAGITVQAILGKKKD